MTIKAVIFDMGGVLIESPSGMWIGMETDLKIDKGSLFAAMLDPVLKTDTEALERGEITAEEFDPIFTQFYNKQYGRNEERVPLILSVVKKLYDIHLVPEMIELLKDLRKAGTKVALLTNNFLADRDRQIPTLPKGLEKYFDVVVESCRVGMRKPEEAIYHHTCELLELKPEECMFLDDLGVNVKAARDLGIKTIKVSHPPTAAMEVRAALKGLLNSSNERDSQRVDVQV